MFNAIPLTKFSNKRNLLDGDHAWHPQYNRYIKSKLDELGGIPFSTQGAVEAIYNIRTHLKELVDQAASSDKNLNEFFRLLNNNL